MGTEKLEFRGIEPDMRLWRVVGPTENTANQPPGVVSWDLADYKFRSEPTGHGYYRRVSRTGGGQIDASWPRAYVYYGPDEQYDFARVTRVGKLELMLGVVAASAAAVGIQKIRKHYKQ